MTSTERVRAWRNNLKWKAMWFDTMNEARRTRLYNQYFMAKDGLIEWDSPTVLRDALAAAEADMLCFDLYDKAVPR